MEHDLRTRGDISGALLASEKDVTAFFTAKAEEATRAQIKRAGQSPALPDNLEPDDLLYFRFSIFNSASFATMSGPDDAGFTALSMWRILPSGAM